MRTRQLPLQITLRDDATFENFLGASNLQILNALSQLLQGQGERFIYCWGELGCGRTHLLQACCHELSALSHQIVYLSMTELAALSPNVLENLEQLSLICIDDIDAAFENTAWEEALMHLYNRVRETHSRLIVAGDHLPQESRCRLLDLRSRLSWGLVYKITSLDDEQICDALQMRAKYRGLELPKEVALYLLKHYPRNMAALFDMLETLDQASLIAKRRLTIPFVKTIFSEM